MPYVVSSKGQVTIPKTIQELFDIHVKDRVEFVREGDQVFLVRVKTLKDLRGAVPSSSSISTAMRPLRRMRSMY
jgi:AbrB family looped-hinge helix DNA binding protein